MANVRCFWNYRQYGDLSGIKQFVTKRDDMAEGGEDNDKNEIEEEKNEGGKETRFQIADALFFIVFPCR